MSFKVAIACEDHVLDQFVARPVLSAVLAEIGKPRAQVHVISSPRTRGWNNLLANMCDLLERYGDISDAVVFLVDEDCDDGRHGRRSRVDRFRGAISTCERNNGKGIVVAGVQELEVWCLWGIRDQLAVPWAEVRVECHPKERFFNPNLNSMDARGPDKGRTRLIQSSLSSGWTSLKSGCPELGQLEDALRGIASGR